MASSNEAVVRGFWEAVAARQRFRNNLGSGVVEAACKTLAAQRLELSRIRWGRGAQAILTALGWDQSERFDAPWALLAPEHQVEVHVLARVIPFEPKKPSSVKRAPRRRSAG